MTKAGGDDLTWDENGRLIGKESALIAHLYEYNWDGKLRRAAGEYGFIELKYDPAGNRVYKSLNEEDAKRYIVDITGGLPVILCEVNPSNGSVTNKYYYANAQILRQDNSTGSYYYVHDRLGSVRLMTDDLGLVRNSYTYNPFGEDFATETAEQVYNPFKFTGQYFDSEFGQYYLRARQYDPQIMRFTSYDPKRGKQQNPLTLHLYLYCLNDPMNGIDPTGESVSSIMGALIAGAAAHSASIQVTAAGVYGNPKLMDIGILMQYLVPPAMAFGALVGPAAGPTLEAAGPLAVKAAVATWYGLTEGATMVTGFGMVMAQELSLFAIVHPYAFASAIDMVSVLCESPVPPVTVPGMLLYSLKEGYRYNRDRW